MNELKNAKYIKALFIDYLLSQKTRDIVIGSEVMFAYKKAVADLIILSNEKIEAYEIKSQNDDFRKITYQLEEYNKVFNYVSIIVTENHFEKAKKLIHKNNGLIIVSNNQDFEIYRIPKENNNLIKEEILSTMTIAFILKHFNIGTNELLASEIRQSLTHRNLQDIKKALYVFFYNRISYKFSNFLQERGTKTHFEDVMLLSMPNKKVTL